jgi:UDP-N-acetylglucosamine--N-acetylmuramyl-(pentapeptide) pyrophosphoryl-undecaprenol N-acetylglucosamine transferase
MNSMHKKTILFTGGGTAGHVTPNLALIEAYGDTVDLHYIGMKDSIEQNLLKETKVPFYTISAGRLRRYMTFKHLGEPFKLVKGFFQAYRLLSKINPDIIFSKGGFVAVPVVAAAWFKKIPVVAHESDMTPGLANRLCFPFLQTICVNFPEVKKYFKHPERVHVTGTPVRQFLMKGSRKKGLEITGFDTKRKTIIVIGGSLGSVIINKVVRNALPELLKKYQVIHICGKGNLSSDLKDTAHYYQLEFVQKEFADLLALSDVAISRSGANMLYELLTLAKPHLLIPLSKKASRGDQIDNALHFEKQGVSLVIQEESLNENNLINKVEELLADEADYVRKIKDLKMESATQKVKDILDETIFNKCNISEGNGCKMDI